MEGGEGGEMIISRPTFDLAPLHRLEW